MGLAEREGPLAWSLGPAMEETLTDLGRRGDIIKTMHLAMTRAKLDRRPELYVIDCTETDSAPLVGRVVDRGTAGDHHDRYYLIIDGVDGRTHYVETGRNPDVAPIGSVVRAEPARAMVRKVDGNIVEIARTANSYYSADLHHAHDRSASSDYVEAHIR